MKNIWNFFIAMALVGGIVGCDSPSANTEDGAEAATESQEVVQEQRQTIGFPADYEPKEGEPDKDPEGYESYNGAIALIQFPFSTFPNELYHTLCLDVNLEADGSVKEAELIVSKYVFDNGKIVKKRQKGYSLVGDDNRGVVLVFSQVDGDTILEVEPAKTYFNYDDGSISIVESQKFSNKGDIDLKVVSGYMRNNEGTDKLCIVGIDDARDAGYADDGGAPVTLDYAYFRSLNSAGPSKIQVHLDGNNIILSSPYAKRIAETEYDDDGLNKLIEWGCD